MKEQFNITIGNFTFRIPVGYSVSVYRVSKNQIKVGEFILPRQHKAFSKWLAAIWVESTR